MADRTIDAPNPAFSLDDFPYVVGALVMLGRMDEAETAYLLRVGQLTDAHRVACRFFLGIGFCRHSYYEKSRRYFVENVAARRKANDAVSRFYRFQGLGFYHYFAGRMGRALRAAERSFAAALEASFLYGRAFAADLKGHCLVQTGEVGLGLQTLELAEHLANQLGAHWLSETVRSSVLSYRTRYGHEADALGALEAALKSLSKQDVYTQSSLLLELAQEQLRRGRVSSAKEALNDCCRIVYGSRNRRHAAVLNLRYAYVHYAEGEPHLALNLLRNALTQIDPRVDVLLELRLRGFERKLVRELKIEVCEKKLGETVMRLTKRVGEGVAMRVLARDRREPAVARFGEDVVGDLRDRIERDGALAAEPVLRSGYFGFLPEVVPVARGARVLYLDLEPGSLTIFDRGDVEHHPEILSRSLRLVLAEIGRGARTKEDLIRNIWKYEYHPLRHDALIYSAMAKLRRLLGRRSHWIEASDAGYHLGAGVAVVAHPSVATPIVPVREVAVATAGQVPSELNHRQQKILRFLAENEFIDAATCRDLFQTSEVTASRDLGELLRLTLIGKVGRGRATKYTRTPQHEGSPG